MRASPYVGGRAELEFAELKIKLDFFNKSQINHVRGRERALARVVVFRILRAGNCAGKQRQD